MADQDAAPDEIGHLVSVNSLVAIALALAAKNHPDPRGLLLDIIRDTEEDLGHQIAKMRGIVDDAKIELIRDAAQHNTIAVGKMADAHLRHMGVPPAESADH
ncbi:hypothetical protein E2F46_11005 [Luteimonas aestuarii]|uniref:Uncharacterized protein n=1 Tax=Luteimonas aestuarii TaxID=453837 RepID=A0A4R5TLH5_9GAMM|nr:hypothetical protein [Luteimonas aestuarii]TDK23440.1 hypothetical protein E2F46_11005 [Luteimonas aestuarii]